MDGCKGRPTNGSVLFDNMLEHPVGAFTCPLASPHHDDDELASLHSQRGIGRLWRNSGSDRLSTQVGGRVTMRKIGLRVTRAKARENKESSLSSSNPVSDCRSSVGVYGAYTAHE